MANREHLDALLKGGEYWNAWRRNKPEVHPDFTYADIGGAEVKLAEANLYGADFALANLGGVNFSGAVLYDANFSWANLRGANLTRADLRYVNFAGADLSETTIAEAKLSHARFHKTNLSRARITDCTVHGVAAWSVNLEGASQSNLRITDLDDYNVTVEDITVAQFIYLLLNNENIRTVLNTLTSKVVLILGRFTLDRKEVLDKLRERLRQLDYLPVLFDFEKPPGRDLTEVITTLAHMARFIIADITDPRSIPQELQAIVPHLPSVPVQPLLLSSSTEYGMFEHFKAYPWVLKTYRYDSAEEAVVSIQEKVIDPAEAKVRELEGS